MAIELQYDGYLRTHRVPGTALRPQAGYDLVAPVYDDWKWQSVWRTNEQPLVISLLEQQPRRPKSILDVGTGTGVYAHRLAGMSYTATGIDVSPRMLEIARRSPTKALCPTFALGDACALPFASDSFESIVCCRVLSHIRDAEHALSEMHRVVTPGGWAVISDVDGRHRYNRTHLATLKGIVEIETYKRTLENVACLARGVGWRVVATHLLASNALRVPGDVHVPSLNSRLPPWPVLYVVALARDPEALRR